MPSWGLPAGNVRGARLGGSSLTAPLTSLSPPLNVVRRGATEGCPTVLERASGDDKRSWLGDGSPHATPHSYHRARPQTTQLSAQIRPHSSARSYDRTVFQMSSRSSVTSLEPTASPVAPATDLGALSSPAATSLATERGSADTAPKREYLKSVAYGEATL